MALPIICIVYWGSYFALVRSTLRMCPVNVVSKDSNIYFSLKWHTFETINCDLANVVPILAIQFS